MIRADQAAPRPAGTKSLHAPLVLGPCSRPFQSRRRLHRPPEMSSQAARPSGSQLGEFRLIRHLRRRFGQTGRAVLRGIGDDAAVIRPSSGHALLLTTDLLAEGIHFDLRTASFEDIGYKAAVANLSDIAAMGGRPQYMLVAVAIPASRTSSDVDRLYRGMMRACRLHKVELVGGDTSLTDTCTRRRGSRRDNCSRPTAWRRPRSTCRMDSPAIWCTSVNRAASGPRSRRPRFPSHQPAGPTRRPVVWIPSVWP